MLKFCQQIKNIAKASQNWALLWLFLLIPIVVVQAAGPEDKTTANCGGTVACQCGDKLVSSYTLPGSLSCPTFGLLIDNPSEDITLDCAGHTINAFFIWGYEGINIRNASSTNITIQNCRIQNFDYSIKLNNTAHVTIGNSTFTTPRVYAIQSLNGSNNNFLNNNIGSQETGLSLDSGNYNNISGNTIRTFNDNGLEITNSDFNTVNNNLLDKNTANIFLNNSHHNQLSYNTSSNAYDFGIYLTNSRFNTIWANRWELNEINAYQADGSTNNLWDNGTTGNYWDDLQNALQCPWAYPISGVVPFSYDYHPTGPNCVDNDGDGYGVFCAYNCPSLGLDCNDNNSAINPGTPEICGNNIDENCDGDDRCRRGGKQQLSGP